MKDYILDRLDCNVIIIDWSKGERSINYLQASANTRVVGAMIAYFIYQSQSSTDKIQLIGHCLGAHIMGFGGAYVQNLTHRRVNQIFGLDPAGYGLFTSSDPKTRLDKTDANLVVIIHTNELLITPEGK